jgi:hypothetical protein
MCDHLYSMPLRRDRHPLRVEVLTPATNGTTAIPVARRPHSVSSFRGCTRTRSLLYGDWYRPCVGATAGYEGEANRSFYAGYVPERTKATVAMQMSTFADGL